MTDDAMRKIGWPEWLPWKFNQRVTKRSGACWTGRICGWYTTELTQIGFCVASENEPGSVQIYPMAALKLLETT